MRTLKRMPNGSNGSSEGRTRKEQRVVTKAREKYWELKELISDREGALKSRNLSTTEAAHLQALLDDARDDLAKLRRACLQGGILEEVEAGPPPKRTIVEPGELLAAKRREEKLSEVGRVIAGRSRSTAYSRKPKYGSGSRSGRSSGSKNKYRSTAREHVLMSARKEDLAYRRGLGLDATEAGNLFIERALKSEETVSLGDIAESVLNHSLTRGAEAGAMLMSNLVAAGVRFIRLPRLFSMEDDGDSILDRWDVGADAMERVAASDAL